MKKKTLREIAELVYGAREVGNIAPLYRVNGSSVTAESRNMYLREATMVHR